MSDLSRSPDVPEGPLTPAPGTSRGPGMTPETRPVPDGAHDTAPQNAAPRNPAPQSPASPGTTADKPRLSPPTGTRASYTWLALTAAAIALVLLIIFILQNTQTVTVTFLWMQGSLPLAVALLIAGVATLILTLAVGAARIMQLRRFSRKAAKRGNKLAAGKP